MIDRGQVMVLVDIALVIAVSLTTIGVYFVTVGPDKLQLQLGRLLVTVVLCVLMYRGHRLARFAMIGLLSLGFGFAFVGLRTVLATGKPLAVVWVVTMAVVYAFAAGTLAWSDSVREFLAPQQDQSIPNLNIGGH